MPRICAQTHENKARGKKKKPNTGFKRYNLHELCRICRKISLSKYQNMFCKVVTPEFDFLILTDVDQLGSKCSATFVVCVFWVYFWQFVFSAVLTVAALGAQPQIARNGHNERTTWLLFPFQPKHPLLFLPFIVPGAASTKPKASSG